MQEQGSGSSTRWVWAGLLGVPAVLGAGLLLVVLAFVGFSGTTAGAAPLAVPGVPAAMLAAYTQAAARTQEVAPGCTGVRWSLLAAIAQIESGQAQGRTVAADGTISPPIIGPRLDGSGAGGNSTAITDTDQGRWDGDATFDHAVGPFQFIPGSWRIYGHDANADGNIDPNNAFDAALSAVAHLCGSGRRNLQDQAQLRAAILSYNHSSAYVQEVLEWMNRLENLSGTGPAAAAGGGGGDCSAPDTGVGGYPNGQIPPSLLCPLFGAPDQRLRADAAAAFNRLSQAYAGTFGAPICVTDSYRTLAAQIDVRRRKPSLAAVPGTSNHGWAKAVDLCGGIQTFGSRQHRWMQDNAGAYGWFHPAWAQASGSKPEPWHWEFP